MKPLYGHDVLISRFVEGLLPWVERGSLLHSPAVGVITDDGSLVGGVVYSISQNGREVCLSVAGIGDWLKRDLIPGLLLYAFAHLGAQKCSAIVRKHDIKVRSLCRLLGFRKEGIIRRFFPDGQDAVYYGLFPDEIKLRRHYGGSERLFGDPAGFTGLLQAIRG